VQQRAFFLAAYGAVPLEAAAVRRQAGLAAQNRLEALHKHAQQSLVPGRRCMVRHCTLLLQCRALQALPTIAAPRSAYFVAQGRQFSHIV
jgi:hypothetical protein